MRRRRAKIRVGVAGAVALTLFPATASADINFFRPGFAITYVATKSRAFGIGPDVAITHYPETFTQFPAESAGYGGFLQAQYYIQIDGPGNQLRMAGGAEVMPADYVGFQLGPAFRTGSELFGPTAGLHAAALGAVPSYLIAPHVGLRITAPIFEGDDGHGFELAITAALRFNIAMDGCFGCIEGRPLRVDEGAAVAVVERGPAWREQRRDDVSPVTDGLAPEIRAELAARWLRAALEEHASIAAFSRLALELMELGAPARLVEGAHRAAIEEISHAKLCFGLASAYAGEDLGPGRMAGATSPPRVADLAELACESLLDGCLNEGLAAARAAAALRVAEDPAVRRALAIIARDEANHAALAWRIVDHCLERGGAPVALALELALGSASVRQPREVQGAPVELDRGADDVLARHGRIEGTRTGDRAHLRARRAVLRRARARLDRFWASGGSLGGSAWAEVA